MMSKNINSLIVKDRELHICHSEGFYSYRIGTRSNENLPCRCVAAIEVYMLCPQFGTIQYGSDTEHFINWVSELQIGSQYRQSPAISSSLKQSSNLTLK
ncbi:MAG: hypothetical protein ACXWF8_00190 [Methylobacter sp.]